MIQDIKPHKLYNQYYPNKKPSSNSIIFSFKERAVLMKKDSFIFPTYKEVGNNEYIYLLRIDNQDCFLCNEVLEIEGYEYINIWDLRSDNEEMKYLLYTLVTAFQLANWYNDNKYCGRCANKTIKANNERALICPNCGRRIYPRIVPAVIVGVINEDKILISRYAKGFKHNALIAGFTEIGETMEETVIREVYEEVGLKVKNITYYKSQPWGFVDDMLIGFYCYVDGDPTIKLDTNELKIATWTKREDIILQPDHLSLTNEMMMMFKEGKIH